MSDLSNKTNLSLDTSRFHELYGDDQSFMLEIFEAFLKITPDALEGIKSSIASKDYEQTRSRTHQLKPTFGMVGMPIANDLAQKLEFYAKDADHEMCEVYFQRLNRQFEQMQSVLIDEIDLIKNNLK